MSEVMVEIIGDCSLPNPELLSYYTRLGNREIFIDQDIDDYVVEYSLNIMKWNIEDIGCKNPKPIKIYVNSNGGSLSAIMNLIDAIKISKTPVITIGMAKCYSSGGLLLMSGHKRYIFLNTTFLLHDGYCGDVNSTAKMIDGVRFTEKQEEYVKNYILSCSTIDSDLYDKNYRKDWFMFSDEMIKYNIADKIITDFSEIS